LERLNADGSFSGVVSLFSRLVSELPSGCFETELVPTIGTNQIGPVFVVLRPGPRLNAFAAALDALDFDKHFPPPVDSQQQPTAFAII
jgi:hypothetical protein